MARYRRLLVKGMERRKFSAIKKSSLWLAEDHLLYLTQYGFIVSFTENSQRYFFEDIENIVIESKPLHARKSIMWFCFGAINCFVMAVYYAVMGWSMPVMSCLGFLAFLSVFAGKMSMRRRGEGCRFWITTCGVREVLDPVTCLKAADGVLKVLLPLIEKKQGKLESHVIAEQQARILREKRDGAGTPTVASPPGAGA